MLEDLDKETLWDGNQITTTCKTSSRNYKQDNQERKTCRPLVAEDIPQHFRALAGVLFLAVRE